MLTLAARADAARRLHAAGVRAAAPAARGARRSRSRPFERILAASVTELELEPDDDGETRVSLTARLRAARAARASAAFRSAAPRGASSTGALDGLERAGRAAGGAPADALVGLGRGRARERAARGGRWRCCARSSASSPAPRTPRVALEDGARCPSRRCRRRARRARGGRRAASDAARRSRGAGASTPRASSYPDLVRLRSGDGLERSRRGGRARLRGRRWRAVLDGLRRERRGRGAVRRRHERGRRRGAAARRPRGGDLARPGAARPPRRGRPRRRSPPTLEAGLLRAGRPRRGSAQQGLTLGHFPQSFEFSTVGGWVATRSAGQASTGYGRIDELVEGVRCATPGRATLTTRAVPGHRRRPVSCVSSWWARRASLGVITAATLRVRPAPGAPPLRGLVVPRLRRGSRGPAGDGAGRRARPTSRACPTRTRRGMSLALASSGSRTERLGPRLPAGARPRGRLPGDHGLRGRARRRGAAARALGRRCCARPAGVALGLSGPDEAWLRGRFAAPYLRDDLLDRGVMVETLETATTWSNLERLYARGRAAPCATSLAARGTPPLVMCHVSHLYRVRAPRSTSPSWPARRPVPSSSSGGPQRRAACDAIVANGGTITHHHAIGPRPRAVDAGGGRGLGHRGAARGQGSARPGRDHEPGQAAARLSRQSEGGLSTTWPSRVTFLPFTLPIFGMGAAQDRIARVAGVAAERLARQVEVAVLLEAVGQGPDGALSCPSCR